ncbi:SRPBCC domain-containing protein [Yoonia sp. R2331]|uniref:SRPBCC domain-containing protein n=1 Tax=Yoonia sp. R2331 TaxID=3237238 RepID=UPI0034E38D5B
MTDLPDVLTRKTIDVPLTVAEAFALFTNGLATWWPKAGPQLRLDPRKGGKITEVDKDGKPITRGTIIAFDPHGYLAFSWHPAEFPQAATIVTVAFTATDTGCRVELIHGAEAILGPLADAVSTSYLRGFDLVLGSFQTHAQNVVVVQ